ncbi:MAG: hypothetical protein V3V50_07570 [Gammaproteobacteria bacterium]
MLKLPRSIAAWNTPDCESILKAEIQQIDKNSLPLQQGLTQSSRVSDDDISVLILNISDDDTMIHVKTGIFYSGIIAGCSCADDPTPQDTITEYCEIQFDIDKQTAEVEVLLLPSE